MRLGKTAFEFPPKGVLGPLSPHGRLAESLQNVREDRWEGRRFSSERIFPQPASGAMVRSNGPHFLSNIRLMHFKHYR
jgi:hypothetical protein